MSDHLAKIYEPWDGNAEALAADIGELGVTVRQWRNRGDIPSRAWPKIIKAAAERDAVLRLEDFLRPEIVSELPSHAVGDNAEWPVSSPDNGPEIIGHSAPGAAPENFIGGDSLAGEGEADSLRPFPEGSASGQTSSSTCPSCGGSESQPQPLSSTGAAMSEAAE